MIGSAIASALPEMQAQAESVMRDLCTIRGKGTAGVADSTTGVRTPTEGALRYSGKCRVRRADNLAGDDQRAQQTVQVARYVVTVPVDTVAHPGDVVTVTASSDPRLLVGAFTVTEVAEGTFRFQRRLLCNRDT